MCIPPYYDFRGLKALGVSVIASTLGAIERELVFASEISSQLCVAERELLAWAADCMYCVYCVYTKVLCEQ